MCLGVEYPLTIEVTQCLADFLLELDKPVAAEKLYRRIYEGNNLSVLLVTTDTVVDGVLNSSIHSEQEDAAAYKYTNSRECVSPGVYSRNER